MALFNPRKRSHPSTVMVDPAPSAPAPEPVPAQLAPSSPALPAGELRLVSSPEPGLRLAPPAPAPEAEENRAEDLRGLPLGTILYRRGLLQQDVLEDALVSGMESGERLGEVLIGQGLIGHADLACALAAQHGLAFVSEAELALDREIAALLPLADARKLAAVPLRADGYAITVVTADPSPVQKDALESRLHRPVIQAVVSKGAFEALLLDLGRPQGPAAVAALAAVPDEPAFRDAEHYHEPQEELMEEVWTGDHVEEAAREACAETEPDEEWKEPAADRAQEPVAAFEDPAPQDWSQESADDERSGSEHSADDHGADEHGPDEHSATENSAAVEPPEAGRAVADDIVRELAAQHEASVGRIGDLLGRIDEGASTFGDLRARLGVLSESLRNAEETVAERDHRLAELTVGYEDRERRIAELVAQVHEREEELRSVGARVEDLSGRLGSAEERLDDRERRLDEVFRHVERRDGALTDFEAKLERIAARFAADTQA